MEQLSNALVAAGWIRKAYDGKGAAALIMMGKPNIGIVKTGFFGLAIEISDDNSGNWGAAVSMLGAALEEEGITGIIINRSNDGNSNAVHIVVGEKPN